MKSAIARALVALAFVTGTNAFAQSDKGNGGSAYVCYGAKDPKTGLREIISAELVDYIEARSLTKWVIQFGEMKPGVDHTREFIDIALKRIEGRSPGFAKKIRDKVNEIMSNWKMLDLVTDKVALSKIADANILIQPTEDCVEMQAAFNKVNPNIYDYPYVFIKQFYEKMDSVSRAGLLLHEAIYNLEASVGATKSDGTREFVRAISSPMIEELTPKAYYGFVKRNLKSEVDFVVKNGRFTQVSEWNKDENLVLAGKVQSGFENYHEIAIDGSVYPIEVKANILEGQKNYTAIFKEIDGNAVLVNGSIGTYSGGSSCNHRDEGVYVANGEVSIAPSCVANISLPSGKIIQVSGNDISNAWMTLSGNGSLIQTLTFQGQHGKIVVVDSTGKLYRSQNIQGGPHSKRKWAITLDERGVVTQAVMVKY